MVYRYLLQRVVSLMHEKYNVMLRTKITTGEAEEMSDNRTKIPCQQSGACYLMLFKPCLRKLVVVRAFDSIISMMAVLRAATELVGEIDSEDH